MKNKNRSAIKIKRLKNKYSRCYADPMIKFFNMPTRVKIFKYIIIIISSMIFSYFNQSQNEHFS
jgi:hypothetical protein